MKKIYKENIDNQLFITYYEYKIESNIKFIKYLLNCNEVYKKIIEIKKTNIKDKEEIEVLDV